MKVFGFLSLLFLLVASLGEFGNAAMKSTAFEPKQNNGHTPDELAEKNQVAVDDHTTLNQKDTDTDTDTDTDDDTPQVFYFKSPDQMAKELAEHYRWQQQYRQFQAQVKQGDGDEKLQELAFKYLGKEPKQWQEPRKLRDWLEKNVGRRPPQVFESAAAAAAAAEEAEEAQWAWAK